MLIRDIDPIAIKGVCTLLANFAKAAINDSDVKIIHANQKAARPRKPFVIINVADLNNRVELTQDRTEEATKHIILKTVDVTFQAFADDLYVAHHLLTTIRDAFYTDLTFDILKGKLALVTALSSINSYTTNYTEEKENIAVMELRFNVADYTKYTYSYIEKVEIEDKVNNKFYLVEKE